MTLKAYILREVHCCDKKNDFNDRIDSLMVLMSRTCPFLNVIVINEPISTCSALLIAFAAKNLQRFYIRKANVVVKCDWPKNPDWDDEFYTWLVNASKSVQNAEKEIGQILGYSFAFLTDEAYRLLDVNVRSFN